MASTSKHKITAIESGSHPVFGDWEIIRQITFTYTPGSAPSFHDPGSGPTIEFVKVEPEPDSPPAFLDLAQKHLNTWAEDWLEDHHDEVVAAAIHDIEAAREYAAEMRAELAREDRREGW